MKNTKKKYRTPKTINMAEKIDAALVHGVLVFVARSLMKKGTPVFTSDADKPRTLQAGR